MRQHPEVRAVCSPSRYVQVLIDGDAAASQGPVARSTSRRSALGYLGVIWLLGWGVGTLLAVAWLLGYDVRGSPSWGELPARVLQDYLEVAVVVGFCLLALHTTASTPTWRTRPLRLPRSRWDWRVEACLAVGGTILTGLGFLVGRAIAPMSYPASDADLGHLTAASARHLLTSWTAGPAEEIFFTVTTVVLARRAGFRWPAVFALSIVGRLAFHVYYGPGVLGLALWAAGAVALYVVTGRVVGLVLAHAAWNFTGDLRSAFPGLEDWVVLAYLAVLLTAAVVTVLTCRKHLQRVRLGTPATSARPNLPSTTAEET